MKDNKSIGPDGYTADFYKQNWNVEKKNWNVVREDSINALRYYLQIITCMNDFDGTTLTFVLKINITSCMKDFIFHLRVGLDHRCN